MNALTHILARSGLLTKDLDYHLIRASMVLIFLAFGHQKWFAYEAQVLIPFISNGPLIFWLYPVFGVRGASWFLGVSEWTFGVLLFFGFWDKRLGFWEPSVQRSFSSGRSPSFHSRRTAGTGLRDFRRWPALCPS
jgi:uncharacterized membrane protein YkgB